MRELCTAILFAASCCISAQQVTGYEYWFDQDHTTSTFVSITPDATFDLLEDINIAGLAMGPHMGYYRLRDSNGRWSSVIKRYFTIHRGGPDELVLLRYWSDPAGTAPSDLTVIFIDPGVQYLDIIRHVLFCNWSTTGNTDVYFQLKDARGNSSSVIKGNFDIDAVIAPPADPGAIVGPLAPPFGSTQEYSVPAGPDAGAYVWVLPTGWTGSSSTNNITVDVGNVNNGSQLGVYALNGCGQSDTVFLDISTGFMERMSGELVTLYPSPTTGQFQVSGIHGNARILVYSSNGQVIRDLQTVQEAYTLDLSNEVNGLYAIRVVMGAAISHLKVMVQH